VERHDEAGFAVECHVDPVVCEVSHDLDPRRRQEANQNKRSSSAACRASAESACASERERGRRDETSREQEGILRLRGEDEAASGDGGEGSVPPLERRRRRLRECASLAARFRGDDVSAREREFTLVFLVTRRSPPRCDDDERAPPRTHARS
jgi:hypothetical protein